MRYFVLALLLVASVVVLAADTPVASLDGAVITIDRNGKTERYRLVAQTPATEPPADNQPASVTPPTTTPPPAPPAQEGKSFAMLATEPIAPAGISVNAVGLDFDPLTTRFEWDFGDPNSPRNALIGFTAGHAYDRPGTYTITLKATPAGKPAVALKRSIEIRPDNRRVIEVAPGKPNELADVGEKAGDNVTLLLKRGGVYDVDRTVIRPGKNVAIRAAGDPKLPRPVIRYTGTRSGHPIINCTNATAGLLVENIAFDSSVGARTDTDAVATAIVAAGRQIVIRDCTFLNLSQGINGNGKPEGILVERCESPNVDGLRRYTIWIEGADWTILDNRVANSTREHCMRGAHWERVLVAFNDLTNLNRQDVDQYDIAKTALNLQKGEYAYVHGNTLRGPSSLGPLGKSDGLQYKEHRSRWYVVENNRIERSPLELQHGLSDVILRNNSFEVTDGRCISVDGFDSQYGRGVANLTITQNVGHNPGTAGGFLLVGGRVDGIVLTENRYDAPRLQPGSRQTANVYVNGSDLSSFRTIARNTWSVGQPLKFAQGGVMYVWPKWSDAAGYLDPAEWRAQSVVKDETFK